MQTKQPTLVVFDTKTNNYLRYFGRSQTDVVKTEGPMPGDMLEEFRVDPTKLYGSDDPMA
jgi:hypothetical protein